MAQPHPLPIALQTNSRLLSLPQEIIEMICEHVLIDSTPRYRDRIHIDSPVATENYFYASIDNYDARDLLAWHSFKPAHLRGPMRRLIGGDDNTDKLLVDVDEVILREDRVLARINFMAWLKALWTAEGSEFLSHTWVLRPGQVQPQPPAEKEYSGPAEGFWEWQEKWEEYNASQYQPMEVDNRFYKVSDLAKGLKSKGLGWSDAQSLVSTAIDVALVLNERN